MLTRSWLLFGFYIIDSEYGTSVQAGKNKTIFTFNLDSINFFFFLILIQMIFSCLLILEKQYWLQSVLMKL